MWLTEEALDEGELVSQGGGALDKLVDEDEEEGDEDDAHGDGHQHAEEDPGADVATRRTARSAGKVFWFELFRHLFNLAFLAEWMGGDEWFDFSFHFIE